MVAPQLILLTETKDIRNIKHQSEWLFIAIPLVLTAIVWFGATQVLYSSDDYQYLHHFAAMRSLADFFKQFYTTDPNSNYWRPIPSGLAVIDFLNWGWNGMGFHVTNFVLHLICTVLVYFTARKIFHLSTILSSVVMLLFGCAASHESNLLWAAGRTDMLATIFILATLLAENTFRTRKKIIWKAAGLFFFMLAMLSKEIGIFVIPLIILLFDFQTNDKFSEKAKRSFFQILPYIITLSLTLLYRSQFVSGSLSQDIAFSAHSVSSFIMNPIYAIGYTITPIDFAIAAILLNNYKLPLLILSIVLFLFGVFVIWKLANNYGYRRYIIPLLFIVITGFFTLQSFERWRIYLPSVGLFVLAIITARDIFFLLKNKWSKGLWAASLFLIFGFHIARSVEAENNWRFASQDLLRLKEDLKREFAMHPERPFKILFLTRPAKIGSAPLMQLAIDDFLSQAELERTNDPSLATGGKPFDNITGEIAVMLYTADDNPNFRGLSVEKINDSSYRVFAASESGVSLIPSITKEEFAAKRDQHYHDSDTLQSDVVRMILEKTRSISAQQIRIEIKDRSFLPMYYDGKKFIIK